jgi:hypothetical protein
MTAVLCTVNEFNRNLFHHALELLVAPSSDAQATKILSDMLETSRRPAILAVIFSFSLLTLPHLTHTNKYLKQQQQSTASASSTGAGVAVKLEAKANSASSLSHHVFQRASRLGSPLALTNSAQPVVFPLARPASSLSGGGSSGAGAALSLPSSSRLVGANAVRVVVDSTSPPVKLEPATTHSADEPVNDSLAMMSAALPPAAHQPAVPTQAPSSLSGSASAATTATTAAAATAPPPPLVAAVASANPVIANRKREIDPKLFNRSAKKR